MNVNKTLQEFDRIANLKVNQSFSLDTPIFIELLQSNKDTFVILAESVFGSYSRWWETKDLTKEEITRHRNKIKKRHEMIQYIIDNVHLVFQRTNNYRRKLFAFLADNIQDQSIDQYGNPYIGLYNSITIDSMLVKKLPFEVFYSINSTIARLELLSKWNEITSCPLI